MWSGNLKNEEAIARVGPQRHKKERKKKSIFSSDLTEDTVFSYKDVNDFF